MLFRCPDCRTRRKDWKLFTRHLRESGHSLCKCGGYNYQHRPGSPYCVSNPWSEYLDAERRGESPDVLAEIRLELAWNGKGCLPGGAEPPF